MQKRILSFILCAVLICGLFPTTATAMGSQAEYTGVCTHGSHEGYIELTSEYLATHNDRLSSGKYYLSGDLNYSGSYYLDVAPNANVELCLNGHTLTFSNQYLLVLDDASLLLENGKVKLESSANKVIWGYNSEAVEIRNCDIDGNGTAAYLVFINGDTGAQEVKITDSKLHNICDSSYAAVSMFGENQLGSLDISRTDIYDLAGASNGIYLDCATAKISNCTLDGGGIVNSLAHISEVSNVSITKNGTIELQKAQITSLERQLRPSIQKRLKEAQELSDLKDENMALEYELNRQKDLMARLMQRVEAALTFLEEKLPEQFRPYVQRARAHILPEQKQEHRRDRGMSMGGMER